METFLQRHKALVMGVLNGFDRLLFRGTLRVLGSVAGLKRYLWHRQVLLKDFAAHAQEVTEVIKQGSLGAAEAAGRPVIHLQSPGIDKLEMAKQIAAADRVESGLVAVLTAVEPCWSFSVGGNRQAKRLELRKEYRKCQHLYHYFLDPEVGFMHARLQTWFPLDLKVCLNGREWLARQMDKQGLKYLRKENCFVALQDAEAAQSLADQQLRIHWAEMLGGVARRVSPEHARVFAAWPIDYYWSLEESEWATDLMFKSAADLAGLYPRLIHHAMTTLGSRDVMRFLGRPVPAQGGIHGHFSGQVVSNLRPRPEGVRIKHAVNGNSVKMYDKQGSVLRVEATIHQPRDIKVYRPKEGDESGQMAWRKLRKGVADLHRRAQVSQAANARYLEAMAAAESTTPLGELAGPLCRRVRWKGQWVRALNPLGAGDQQLLAAIGRGEFVLQGLRNRDLKALLYATPAADATEERRRSAAVTRKLRLLQAHGLITKVQKTHRYQLSPKARMIVNTLLAAQQADADKLNKLAA